MTPPARSRDLRAMLDERAEAGAAWRPEIGETLVGRIERFERREARFGPCDVALVRDEASGELRAVWLAWPTLADRFTEQRPQVGERIGVRRLEDGQGKRGAYRRFALVVDRPADETAPSPLEAADVANPFD